MSQWQYERNRKIVEAGEAQRTAARKFVEDCLVIMDGSLEAGLVRIGTERFEQTIRAVIKTLPIPLY